MQHVQHASIAPESPRRFPLNRFGRAARTSLPFMIAGTLAVSATGLSAPAHAAPVDPATTPQRFHQPTVRSIVAIPQVAALSKKALQAAPRHYTVAAGDTVSEIADRFGLTTQSILAANGLDPSSMIFPGQKLELDGKPSPAAGQAMSKTKYTVKSGDTMSGIAERTGGHLADLLTANGLVPSSVIFPGQTVMIPGSGSAPAPTQGPAAPKTRTHTVAPGDTMSGIAEKAGVSLGDLLTANSLVPSSIIYPGQTIAIPGADVHVASTGTAESSSDASSDPLPKITMTAERRSNAETIIRVGYESGVSEYGIVVALATAMQESGLKNFDHGDRDSLGIFQQRSSTGWGTPAQTRDPERAAQAFFGGDANPNSGVTRGLMDIPGWQKMSLSEAAQAVQISGWPNHYAKWETAARDWLDQLG